MFTSKKIQELNSFDDQARAYKNELLAGNSSEANDILLNLYNNRSFRRHILSYQKTFNLEPDEFIDTVFSVVFGNPEVIKTWNDKKYSILSFIKLHCQLNGLVGREEKRLAYPLRTAYDSNESAVVASIDQSVSDESDLPFSSNLLSDDPSVEDQALREGDLTEDSEVVEILNHKLQTAGKRLDLCDLHCYIVIKENRINLYQESIIEINEILRMFHREDEELKTYDDFVRFRRCINKRFERYDFSEAEETLRGLHLLKAV